MVIDELATVTYFEQLIPHLDDTAIIIFDDISWSDGMPRAWKKIISREGIVATVDLKKLGIVIMRNKSEHVSPTL